MANHAYSIIIDRKRLFTLLSAFSKKVPLSALTFLVIVTQLLSDTQMVIAEETRQPNIIFILADDMGYGDVQVLNSASKIPTPHLDQLAAEGMTFTDAHTPSSVCTPTRYGVLTGRYCWRTRLKSGVLNGYGEPLIQDSRETIAEALGRAGYHTGIVGKWHLGLGFAKKPGGKEFDFSQPVSNGPHTHGFNESFIIPASLDFPPYVFIKNGEITEFPKIEQSAQKFPAFLRKGERSPDFVMEDVLDDLLEQAQGYITSQAKSDKPFFLYFPLTAPHKPVLPHPRYRGKTELGPYGDFVHQVDEIIGGVTNTVDKAGIAENTLIIYTSDNGSFMHRYQAGMKDHVQDESIQAYDEQNHTANGKFRGTKADIWEAGHHVPFFARWKGKIAAGSKCDETICLTDFFATAAELADVKIEGETAPDSFSLVTLMQGNSWSTPRPPVIHHSVAGMFSIRDGAWKLVLGNGSGGREAPRGKPFAKPYQLYNLADDIAEKNNLADQHPEVVQALEKKCLEIRDSGTSH